MRGKNKELGGGKNLKYKNKELSTPCFCIAIAILC